MPNLDQMFKAGAHFAYARSRRHPSVAPYIFGVKNRVEIFDLEKTSGLLDAAKEFVKKLGSEGKQILFVAGKAEARDTMKNAALSLGMPYVAGRWIGGTFTNFANIRKRVEKMNDLISQREKGELAKYTKKERLLIDREIDRLSLFFSGLVLMKDFPKAVFVVDPKKENIAVTEARKSKIPVVGLMGSDCNLKDVDFPVIGNDSSISSIRFFVSEIVAAYESGKSNLKS